jgi:geranylgeranyl reductase family protein
MQQHDLLIIGGGPAGSAAAITAARAGLKVVLFEKGPYGRDKVCGDGLTPRAIGALNDLGIDHSVAHKIDGLRMITGKKQRELAWPTTARFPNHGAVWPRQRFDNHLLDVAISSGADVRFESEALPVLEDGRVVGVSVGTETFRAPFTILAAGAQGMAAKMLGAERDPNEPFGLAIRAYAPTPRHAERHLEACLSLSDEHGVAVPGYGWMFPAGDGTVNIGVGALSTMKGFKKLNLNTLLDQYATLVRDSWSLGDYIEKPRAWRLPMSCTKRHGPGWVAIGDAAGFVNPMNGEGIDYGLETGHLAAQLFADTPANSRMDFTTVWPKILSDQYGTAFSIARRLAGLITVPKLLPTFGPIGMRSQFLMTIALRVMGNLITPQDKDVTARLWHYAGKSSIKLDHRPPFS